MNVDVSPDGKTLVFDLLGDLYQLAITGGDAVPLTSGMAWDRAPIFSPDGEYVYFVSDRIGYKNLWQLKLADRSLRQVTSLNRDIVGAPNWSKSANGPMVGIESSEIANASKVLHHIDPASGTVTPIELGDRSRNWVVTYSGVESASGEVFFSEPSRFAGQNSYVRLHSFESSTQTRKDITPVDSLYSDYKPQLSHNEELLAYYRQYDDRHTELRIRNRTTGRDDSLIALADADDAFYRDEDARPNYAFTPDDQSIVFWHDGKIQRVTLDDGTAQIIPFNVVVEREIVERAQTPIKRIGAPEDTAIILWPSLSGDGQTLVFAAIGYVWVMDVQTGGIRRLTDTEDLEYMPAISPDGQTVAYISFSWTSDDGYGRGRLVLADVRNRKAIRVLQDADANFLLPKWSEDGAKIAVILQKGIRGNKGYGFGWASASSGGFNEVGSVSPASWSLYTSHALSVGFDVSGDKLFFSYPESNTQTVLVSSGLAEKRVHRLAVGTVDVASIIPAPDLKHLALTQRDNSIWIVPFDASDQSDAVSPLRQDARRVSNNQGYYVDWNGVEQLTFGFGTNVYKYGLQSAVLQSVGVSLSIESLANTGAISTVVFNGARLITLAGAFGAGPVIERGTVITRGNRIIAVGPAGEVAIPTNASVIDARGKTIVPGFLDTHYHSLGGYLSYGLPETSTFDDESALAFGVTSAWDPASTVDVAPAAADLQLAGRTAGPRWSFSAAVVNDPSSAYLSAGFLDNYAQAVAVAESRGILGATVLKETSTRTRQAQQWFSAAARESGLGIVAHLEDFDGTMTRIVDGYTGGDHPYLPSPFYQDVQELLNQSGFVWTPNVTITGSSLGSKGDKVFFYCNAVFQSENESYREKLDDHLICSKDDQPSPSVTYDIHRVSRVAEQVAGAASAGATIGVSAHNMPGALLHMEMWYLWKGGMPIEDVLRAATMTNAEKLGLQEEIGSLEVGKVADFLILDENPLDDILNTLSIQYTIQGGVIYDADNAERIIAEELQRRLASEPAANDDDVSMPKTGTNN